MNHKTETPSFVSVPNHTRLFHRDGGTYYLRAKVPEKIRHHWQDRDPKIAADKRPERGTAKGKNRIHLRKCFVRRVHCCVAKRSEQMQPWLNKLTMRCREPLHTSLHLFRRRLSPHHAGAAPCSAMAELEVVRPPRAWLPYPTPYSPSGTRFRRPSEVMFKPASTRPSTSTTTNQVRMRSHNLFLPAPSALLLACSAPSKRKTGSASEAWRPQRRDQLPR